MMRKICLATLLVPVLAWAQPRSANDWFKEGENQYNLGNFEKAIDAFKQGFALETKDANKPLYLYNVAQAYRLSGDCKNALFFYRRFLSLEDGNAAKPLDASTRKTVEGWISDAEACVQQATAFGKKPPSNNLPPDGDSGDKRSSDGDSRSDGHSDGRKKAVATGHKAASEEEDDDGGSITRPAPAVPPHLISARLTGGGTKVSAGNLDVPVQATFALIGGYPLAIDRWTTIELGAAFTFTPVPDTFNSSSKTMQMISVMANAGVSYEVIPKLSVRGDLGLGVLLLGNASGTNFTMGMMTSGALTMFHVRGAASADYAVTPNIVVTVMPVAFSYSPPKTGLNDTIKSITAIDFMAGIGYRM